MADLAKIVEELSTLTVLEAADLSKLLEEKWGVSAAAPVGGVVVAVPVVATVYHCRVCKANAVAVNPAAVVP